MAQLVRANALLPSDVESITAICHPVVAQDNADGDPQTLLAGRLSLPFNVALVLVLGDVMSTDLDEATLRDERIRRLLRKITVVADEAMQRYGCCVRVSKTDGTTAECRIDEPRGSDTHPLLWTDVVEKFHRLVAPVGSDASRRAVVAAVENLESIDVPQLMLALKAVRAEV
jgi:2-methylcitrate dehydratase PrpD